MWKEVPRTRKKKSFPVTCRVVTSVTHNSPSPRKKCFKIPWHFKKSSMARSLPVENLLPQNVGSLSTTCSNVLKQPNGELLVAVNHNQLRTMESETVDPIDWSHPPPSWAVPPERLVHSINQCNLSAGTERATTACEAPPCLCGHS